MTSFEGTLRDFLRQLARLGESGDLRGHAAVAEGGHESLGGGEPRRPGLAQGLGELDVGRVRETVGRAHLLGQVHADPVGRPFGHERPEVVVALHEVVGPAGLEHVALHPQGRALDPFAPAVGEHVEGDAAGIAAAQVLVQRVVVAFLEHHDPHVDAGVAHGPGQDEVELVLADPTLALPAAAGLSGLGAARRRRRGQKEAERLPPPGQAAGRGTNAGYSPGPPTRARGAPRAKRRRAVSLSCSSVMSSGEGPGAAGSRARVAAASAPSPARAALPRR